MWGVLAVAMIGQHVRWLAVQNARQLVVFSQAQIRHRLCRNARR
jgi:hypothetical protein